jgi:hypothetical protein
MLSVAKYAFMLRVIMLNVVQLSVCMLRTVARTRISNSNVILCCLSKCHPCLKLQITTKQA